MATAEATKFTPVDASKLFEKRSYPMILVRSMRGAGYWGRGPTLGAAIKAAGYLSPGDDVYVMQCDDKAYIDDDEGNLHHNGRGPIYTGHIKVGSRDVRLFSMDRPAEGPKQRKL